MHFHKTYWEWLVRRQLANVDFALLQSDIWLFVQTLKQLGWLFIVFPSPVKNPQMGNCDKPCIVVAIHKQLETSAASWDFAWRLAWNQLFQPLSPCSFGNGFAITEKKKKKQVQENQLDICPPTAFSHHICIIITLTLSCWASWKLLMLLSLTACAVIAIRQHPSTQSISAIMPTVFLL